MAYKKIIFVIVEGPSDDEALGVVLSKIFNTNSVYIEILHHDITTENGVNSTNIIKKVVEVIKKYASGNHFTNKDFVRVIHLVDTDGAFIPDNCIVEDPNIEGFIYTTNQIKTKYPSKAIKRNKQKRDNLIKISRTSKVWNITYDVFYMSSNLEHVLFNKLNCSDEEKEELSYSFAKKYCNDIAGFKSLLLESEFSVCDDYLSSWEFIEDGTNSLNRYTNFGLCFKNDLN